MPSSHHTTSSRDSTLMALTDAGLDFWVKTFATLGANLDLSGDNSNISIIFALAYNIVAEVLVIENSDTAVVR